MIPIKDIIVRIRSSTHDKQETGYSDSDLIGYINDGIRMMRRIIMDMRPELLATTHKGVIPAGECDIAFDTAISKVIRVCANGTELRPIPTSMAIDAEEVGEPTMFYVPEWKTVRLYPIPTTDTPYSISLVNDMKLIDAAGESPFPTDIDDFVIEYAAIRASVSNEFDVSQESSIMSNIISQAATIIRNITPDSLTISGYWSPGRRLI